MEKCFIQNKYTPNAKLTIVWTDKTTFEKFSLYFETRKFDTLHREAALKHTLTVANSIQTLLVITHTDRKCTLSNLPKGHDSNTPFINSTCYFL